MTLASRLLPLAALAALACTTPACAQEAAASDSLETQCEDGNIESCHAYGLALYRGEGMEQDKAGALELWTRNCDAGWGRSCNNIGAHLRTGDGLEKDEAKSFEYFTKGCDLGDDYSCVGLSQAYSLGLGVEPDYPRAAELAQAGCDDDFAGACREAGVMYARGHMGDADPAERYPFYDKACELGDIMSCVFFADGLWQGEDIEGDATRARSLYSKACDGDIAIGCFNYAVMSQDGAGGPVDTGVAFVSFARSCELGEEDGCTVLRTTRENCTASLSDIVVGGEFGPDQPKIIRNLAVIGSDPKALFESGIDGRAANLVEFQQAYREGDEDDRVEDLDAGEREILVWPGHDRSYYVEASPELTSTAEAEAHLERICSFSDKGIMIQRTLSEVILSRTTIQLD